MDNHRPTLPLNLSRQPIVRTPTACVLSVAGYLSVRKSPVPEARYFNNPTRNGVPCGVASAMWRRRAESTLLPVYVMTCSGVSPTRCYAYGRTPPTQGASRSVGLLGYRAFGTECCHTLGRGYRQRVVRRPLGFWAVLRRLEASPP